MTRSVLIFQALTSVQKCSIANFKILQIQSLKYNVHSILKNNDPNKWKINSFLHKLIFVLISFHSNRKVTNIVYTVALITLLVAEKK